MDLTSLIQKKIQSLRAPILLVASRARDRTSALYLLPLYPILTEKSILPAKKSGGRSATKEENGVDASNKKRYNGSINNLVKIKASDSTGNIINKIQAVHPNRNALKEMTDDKVLYLSDNKKKPNLVSSPSVRKCYLWEEKDLALLGVYHILFTKSTLSVKKAADAPRGFTAIGTEASATTRNKKRGDEGKC